MNNNINSKDTKGIWTEILKSNIRYLLEFVILYNVHTTEQYVLIFLLSFTKLNDYKTDFDLSIVLKRAVVFD